MIFREKTLLVSLLLLICFSANAKTEMILYTKDGKQYILEEESKKENNILISKSYKYKNTEILIASVDSIRVGEAIYKTILYKNDTYMARVLFSGANEGYKIHYNSEKIIVIKNDKKEEYIPITKTNKVGAYNYLFPDCFKKDSNLYKIKSAASDDNIIKEVTKTINCDKKTYTVYKKPMKIDVYIALIGGINLFKPNVKSAFKESSPFNFDNAKPQAGYSVGGKIGFVIKNRIDVSVASIYSVGKAKLDATVITEFFSVKDTGIFTGVFNNKSIDFNIDFKYIILKSKLSPTFLAGFYFSSKVKNNVEYKYTYNNGVTFVDAKDDLSGRVFGFNIGAGLNYKPINRVNIFVDLGYKIGASLKALAPASSYEVSEGTFYTNAGIAVKLNK